MNEQAPIKVFIVDDHAMVRGGLSNFLLVYPDLVLVGEAESGEEAVQRCAAQPPDVVLMDLKMPGMDGVTATRQLLQVCPQVKVIALTSFAEQALVQGALQAGAIGYLQKNVNGAELAAAIRSAHAGRMTLSSEAAQVLAQSAIQPQLPQDRLTDREREVLVGMVEGLNNSEIADRLVISLGTVKFHISNIFQKLEVESRVQAVKRAIEQKLV